MGNCQALLTWPTEIMKILHCVFSALAVMCCVVFGGTHFTKPTGAGSSYVSDGGVTLILMAMVLVASALLLIWFIFGDPRTYKTYLLIYYLVAIAACGAAFVIAVVNYNNTTSCGSCPYNVKNAFLGVWLCSLVALISYGASAYFNGADGKA